MMLLVIVQFPLFILRPSIHRLSTGGSSFSARSLSPSCCLLGSRRFYNRPIIESAYVGPGTSISSSAKDVEETRANIPHGLLFSSFTEGVRPSKEVANFVKKRLWPAMVSEALREQQTMEQLLSAKSLLLDQLLEQPMYENPDSQKAINYYKEQLVLPLRLLYIPTAMYALRKDSLNTPGKQRQRARADAKSRRDTIVQYLQNLFVHNPQNATTNAPPFTIDISALTLDLEDGSLKHPFGSTTVSSNKVNNKAITISKSDVNINITSFLYTYSPHIIYVDGGNTFWLHHCLRRNNNCYWDALVQFCSNAQHNCKHNSTNSSPLSSLVLYCGQSAGAIVAGSCVETATWKGWDDPSIVPGMEDPQSWKGVPGMDLFCNNISIFPHYAEEWKELVQSKNQTDFTTDHGTAPKTHLICLSNSEVLAITGGCYTNGSFQQNMQFFSTANNSFPIASFPPQ